jgi:hypothetical protein
MTTNNQFRSPQVAFHLTLHVPLWKRVYWAITGKKKEIDAWMRNIEELVTAELNEQGWSKGFSIPFEYVAGTKLTAQITEEKQG